MVLIPLFRCILNWDYVLGFVARAKTPIKYELFLLRHSNHYGEGEKVAKLHSLQVFLFAVGFLMHNPG
jgi:hypothetical protein